MPNLENKIDSWCRAIHRYGWNRQAKIDELADHLHCEVARLKKEGLTEPQAFEIATGQMGHVEELANESRKDHGALSNLVCQLRILETEPEKSWIASLKPQTTAAIQLVVSVFFAAAIIVSTYLLRDTNYWQIVTNILIAIWWIPFTILAGIPSAQMCKKESKI